jgi:hypothetical protein
MTWKAGAYPVLVCLAIHALTAPSAAAQEQRPFLAIPKMDPCRTKSHPRLPVKWRAAYLMAPFTNAQLVLGEIVHDGSISATRVTLYGLRRGQLDLLLHGESTYVLASNDSDIVDCQNLGDTGWRPLPRDWLGEQSECAGSAPIGETATDWWKTPVDPAPSSYWIWYKAFDQTPFRLVFQSANDRLAALSRYAVSNQVNFNPLRETDLAVIANACKSARSASVANPRAALDERIDGLANDHDRADQKIQALMPQLASCPATPLPEWPDKLAITGLMTPFDFNENPYPTEVLFDWSVPAQRTRIFSLAPVARATQDALLLGPHGYNITYHRNRGPACAAVLPGTVRPDWASRAPCTCEAMITGKTPLTPYGSARVLACPLASPRAAWAWYTIDGRPMSFAVTSLRGDQGFGLFAVLDYRDWLPGRMFPRSAFRKPSAQCQAPGGSSLPQPQCSTCHVGSPNQ